MKLSLTKKKEIRKFGTMAFLIFGGFVTIAYWKQKYLLTCVFGFLSSTGLGFLLIPSFLSPVYDIWMKVSHFIGCIITMITLTLGYYLVITPFALLKRVFGGRPLPMKPDKTTSTYWVARKEPAQSKERFKKRF